MLSPLLFFLALELALRLAGFGYPTAFLLPDHVNGQDVLVQNDRFAWRFFGPEMARTPCPLEISVNKPPGTVRIFVFGESAAFGDPQPEFGLPRVLEAVLAGRYPGLRFEVETVAMTAINSHAILPIARDCAARHGDVWVIYAGNNEVVGPYGSGTVFGPRAPPLALVRASLAVKSTRVGQLLESALRGLQNRPATRSEWGGMEMFVQNQVREDDPRMATVYSSFERNLSDILQVGLHSGAKIVVSTVVSNLKDCAPFASLHRPDLSAVDLSSWEKLYQQGITSQQAGRPADAVEAFRQADSLDTTFAEMHFHWGQCLLALGRDTEARSQFTLARDLDTLRFRADSRINEIVRHQVSVRAHEGVRLVDAEELLARQSPHGLPGNELLYEHVHLNFEGNYLLALALAQQVASLLPDSLAKRAEPGRPWPSPNDCARRLAYTDADRFKADSEILHRFYDPPFTMQFDHAAQYERLRREMAQLLPATQPVALRTNIALYQAAIAAAPGDWILQRGFALLKQQLGDLPGAAESCQRVVQLQPLNTEGWLKLGAVLADQNLDTNAAAAFEQALRLDPRSADALLGLGQICARNGQRAEACRKFEEALKLKPYWGAAHLALGKVLEGMGKSEEAQRHYRTALQHRMLTPAALTDLAKFCFDKGWYAQAATNLLESLELSPGDAAAHALLGQTYSALGRSAEALNEFSEALRLEPDSVVAHFLFGLELGRQGRHAEASEQFSTVVRLKPDLAEARLNLGVALLQLGRKDEALAQFEEVLRRDPTNAIARQSVQAIRAGAPPGAPR